MGGKRRNRGHVNLGDGQTVVDRRQRQAAPQLDPSQLAAVEAIAKLFITNPMGAGGQSRKADGAKRPAGPQPRPLREGDPPPGPPVFAKDSTWCTLTWQNKLYWVDTARGGWSCKNCHMPANHNHRWYCVICGKAAPKDTGKPPQGTPAVQAPTKPNAASRGSSSPDTANSSDGVSSDDDMEEAEEHEDGAAVKCAAEQGPCPNLHAMIAAQKTPSVSIATDSPGGANSAKDLVDTAQAEADGAATLLQLAQSIASTPKAALESLAADVDKKKKALEVAKEKAQKAGAPASPATALLRLESAQEKGTQMEKDHRAWTEAKTKKKDEMSKKFEEEVQLFRKRSALVAQEADKRQ